MLYFQSLDPCFPLADAVGLIPAFFDDCDPRGAIEQLNERYAFGGGWFDLKVGKGGFKMSDDFKKLTYPGDPPLRALAEAYLHDTYFPFENSIRERIIVFQHAFVAVVQEDGSFRVARID